MIIHKSSLTAMNSLDLAASSTVALQTTMLTTQRFFEQSLHQLTTLKIWNYLLVLVAVVIEGPVATLLGGVWAAMGRVSFWGVLATAFLAGLLADSFWYYLGYYGREQLLGRWGRLLRVDVEAINRMEEVLFGRSAARVLFVAKLTSALVIPALIAAGITNMGWRKVMRTILPAHLLWSAGLTGLGFVMADSYRLISQKVENFGWIVGLIAGLVLAGYIFYRWRKANEKFILY